MTKISKYFKKIKPFLPFLILLSILCWAVFAQSIDNGFVSDDISGFVRNDQHHSLKEALTFRGFSFVKITYALTYQIFGINPVPLHILAIFLHNINAILVFIFAMKITRSKKIAYISSALFCVHPLVTEPVNWISARPYLIITTVTLTSSLLYIKFKREKKLLYLISSILFFALGIYLVRSAWMLTIPFFLINLDLFLLDDKEKIKSKLIKFIPYFMIIAIFIVTFFMGSLAQRIDYMTGVRKESLENERGLTPNYATRISYTAMSATRLLFYPAKLSLYHEGEVVNNWHLLSGQLILVGSVVLFIYLLVSKKTKIAGLVSGIYVSLLPTFSPIQVGWFIADRYLYLSTVLFSILMAMLLIEIGKKIKVKNATLYLTLIILGAYIVKDTYRNKDWQNRKTLWEATARTDPKSPRVYNNLGDVYGREGNIKKSIESFQKAIELYPQYAEAMYNLGSLYKQLGEEEKGQELIDRALEIKPSMIE